jgi:hypothetical protein
MVDAQTELYEVNTKVRCYEPIDDDMAGELTFCPSSQPMSRTLGESKHNHQMNIHQIRSKIRTVETHRAGGRRKTILGNGWKPSSNSKRRSWKKESGPRRKPSGGKRFKRSVSVGSSFELVVG